MSSRRGIALVLGVAALSGCGGASTKTETVTAPAADSAPPTSSGIGWGRTAGAVGSTLTSTDQTTDPPESIKITLADYRRGARPDDPSLAQSLLESDHKSSAEYEWVRLEITAQNVGAAKVTVLGPDFKAIDSQGNRYEGEDVDPGGVFEPDADAQDLQPGDRVHGYIAILVPKARRLGQIRYANLGGEGVVQWKVPS
jgi:hypothetical protein